MDQKLDNTLKPIEEYINSGLTQRFFQVFGIPVGITNTPNKKAVFAALVTKKPDVKLPYAFASYSSRGLSETNSYAASPLARRGMFGGASHDRVLTYQLRLIPVDTVYQITVLSQDQTTLDRFVRAWLYAAIEGSMKFTITYGIADIDINLELDREISMPQRSAGIDEPEEYELTANIRVKGYMSKDLQKSQAALTTEGELLVGTEEAVEAALAGDPRGVTQVFRFNRTT